MSPDELKNKLKSALAMVHKHLGCGDNSCLYKKPSGMATNGGCNCPGERGNGPMPRAATLALASLAIAAAKFVEENEQKPCKFKVGDRVHAPGNTDAGKPGTVMEIEEENDTHTEAFYIKWDDIAEISPDDPEHLDHMYADELELFKDQK